MSTREWKEPVNLRDPNSCPMCGGPTSSAGVMCAWCADRVARDEGKIDRLMSEGHTYHCAARQTWGDGCCECSKGE